MDSLISFKKYWNKLKNQKEDWLHKIRSKFYVNESLKLITWVSPLIKISKFLLIWDIFNVFSNLFLPQPLQQILLSQLDPLIENTFIFNKFWSFKILCLVVVKLYFVKTVLVFFWSGRWEVWKDLNADNLWAC